LILFWTTVVQNRALAGKICGVRNAGKITWFLVRGINSVFSYSICRLIRYFSLKFIIFIACLAVKSSSNKLRHLYWFSFQIRFGVGNSYLQYIYPFKHFLFNNDKGQQYLQKPTLFGKQLIARVISQYFKAAGDKLLMNKFIRQNFGGGLTLKTYYLKRLGADSIATLQRAWGMVEVQQDCFCLIDCASLRCYKLPKLRICKTQLRVQVFFSWRRQNFLILPLIDQLKPLLCHNRSQL